MNYKNNISLNIIFEEKPGGTTLTMQCSPEEKICELLKRYKNKVQRKYKMKFIRNGESLNENLTVTQCGLKDGYKILAYDICRIKGAGYWYMKEINI